MTTPTLGYEDDRTIAKSDIALTQLNHAISLFIKAEFLCALTLAGASEGVLAGLLSEQGKPSVVEESIKSFEKIREITGLTVMENRAPNKVFNDWNAGRNAAKHHGKNDVDPVTFNFFDESYWMIKRALKNAEALEIKVTGKQDFENWCIIQIHL